MDRASVSSLDLDEPADGTVAPAWAGSPPRVTPPPVGHKRLQSIDALPVRLRQSGLRVARAAGVEGEARRVREALRVGWSRRGFREDQTLARLLRLSLPSDANCIDVGANLGTILDHIVAAAPEGRHLAFEPIPELAAALAERFPTVDVRREAVSDRRGSASFSAVPSLPSRSGLTGIVTTDREVDLIPVETVSLDAVVTWPVSFLKIDVEGGEVEVLRGARRVLNEYRPLVAFEHGAPKSFRWNRDPARTRELFDILRNAELRLFDMDGQPLGLPQLADAVRTGRRWNFIAHP